MALLEKGNPAEAAQWLRKAAMQGLTQSQQELGTMLKQGQGVPADKAEAYVWLALSARAGNSAVSSEVAVLESELGPSQAGAAKARVAELEPGVTRVVVAKGCTGWQGEFSRIPTAPPPDIQIFCR
jgi:TPR repeat protein